MTSTNVTFFLPAENGDTTAAYDNKISFPVLAFKITQANPIGGNARSGSKPDVRNLALAVPLNNPGVNDLIQAFGTETNIPQVVLTHIVTGTKPKMFVLTASNANPVTMRVQHNSNPADSQLELTVSSDSITMKYEGKES